MPVPNLHRTVRLSTSLTVGTILLAAVTATHGEEARSSRATGQRAPVVTGISAELMRDQCRRINIITGHWEPCRSGGGGSTGTGSSRRSPSDELPSVAFDLFESDYDDNDFDDDPDSVIVNAYLLSQLAGAAYRPEPEDPREPYEIAQELGLQVPYSPAHGEISKNTSAWHEVGEPDADSKAFVFFNNEAVFVTFEGSTGGPLGTDWLENNLDVGPHDKPEWGHDTNTLCGLFTCIEFWTNKVTLHQGFHDAMSVIYSEVRDAVEPLVEDGRSLWITGHSLGGAVAMLTAFRLEFEDDIPVQGVHVFGAPAVGDANWQDAFEAQMSNVHTWHYEYDPVPVLLQAPSYYHVGTINNIYSDESYLLDVNGPQMFGYPLWCSPFFKFNVAHMSYWRTMHGLLEDEFPSIESQVPGPLSAPEGNCYTG